MRTPSDTITHFFNSKKNLNSCFKFIATLFPLVPLTFSIFPFLPLFHLKLERSGVTPRDNLVHLKFIGGSVKKRVNLLCLQHLRTGLNLKFVPFSSWAEAELLTHR